MDQKVGRTGETLLGVEISGNEIGIALSGELSFGRQGKPNLPFVTRLTSSTSFPPERILRCCLWRAESG